MHAAAVRQLIDDDPRHDRTFAPEVRRAVGLYAKRRRADGARWRDIQQETGVSSTSARKWMRELESGGFQQVVVVEPPQLQPPPPELVITSPSGYALTGCSFEQALALMQSLR